MVGVRACRSLGLALESAVAALGTVLDRHSPKLLCRLYVAGVRLCACYAVFMQAAHISLIGLYVICRAVVDLGRSPQQVGGVALALLPTLYSTLAWKLSAISMAYQASHMAAC